MLYNKIILYSTLLFTGIINVNAQTVQQTEVTYNLSTIEEKYPDVFTNIKPQNPDTAYEIGKKTEGFLQDFIGENGKTQFYLVYAKHLQNLNQNENAKKYRPIIIELLQSINRVNQLLDNKVGYYDQMQTMLVAYSEYALYNFQHIDASKYEKLDVDKQKKLFIKSIQQKVKTKNQQLNLTSQPNFIKNQEIINDEIYKIDKLITDTFLLKMTQVFHYTYY